MGFVFSLVLWLLIPAAIIGLPAAAIVLGIERHALVADSARISFADVENAQALWQRYDPRRMEAGTLTMVVARVDELNAAVTAGLAGFKRFRGRIGVDPSGVGIQATVELPPAMSALGGFINLDIGIASSNHGLKFDRVRIGKLALPPALAAPAIQIALEALLGNGRGQELVESIRSINVSGQTVAVTYRPPERIFEDIKAAARDLVRVGNPEVVRLYYNKLVELARRHGSTAQTSLTSYIQPVFRLAEERSRSRDPVEENRAAVLALAMYFGDRRVERFIGQVLDPELRGRQRAISHVGLAGRHDFVQHFVTSAGLTLTGGGGIADIVGVAKEIHDTGIASGFSFTDIAADRAGIRFAEVAIASPLKAVSLQRVLAGGVTESDIFPRVLDLPEGLTKSQFQSRYGDTDSPAFHRLVAEIDRRIQTIPLYR